MNDVRPVEITRHFEETRHDMERLAFLARLFAAYLDQIDSVYVEYEEIGKSVIDNYTIVFDDAPGGLVIRRVNRNVNP